MVENFEDTLNKQNEWYIYHSDLSLYASDCTVTSFLVHVDLLCDVNRIYVACLNQVLWNRRIAGQILVGSITNTEL